MISKKIVLVAMALSSTLFACNISAQKVSNISVVEFDDAIKKKGIQVLDVRTPAEFKSGHLNNAVLADWMNQQNFSAEAVKLDKKKPVYAYCHSGGRSSAAAQWLVKNGFTVYNLNGGISAWKEAGKPVVGKDEAARD